MYRCGRKWISGERCAAPDLSNKAMGAPGEKHSCQLSQTPDFTHVMRNEMRRTFPLLKREGDCPVFGVESKKEWNHSELFRTRNEVKNQRGAPWTTSTKRRTWSNQQLNHHGSFTAPSWNSGNIPFIQD